MAAKPRAVLIVGIIAVVIAVVASVSLYNYLKRQEARVKEAVATERIVVASEEIPMGSAVDTAKVKLVDWPKVSLPIGSFTSAEQVAGRMSIERFVPGEPIVEAKLIPRDGIPGIMPYKIPEGHRAMTVAVDQVAGVAGFLAPGNMVDVVLTVAPTGAQQPVSRIIPSLQNIPILAIGQIVEQKEGTPVVVPTVTMDVTPQQAEDLAISSTQGRLQLVLRRAGDKEVAKTRGATIRKVMADIQPAAAAPVKRRAPRKVAEEKPAPPPPPPPPLTVEMFKGTSKTTEQFKSEISK